MSRLKAILVLWVSCVTSVSSVGQSYSETALLFSRTIPGGSARILGFGGTQISLGGDYSSALSNPAGLGMYNRSEFTITPAYNFGLTKSDFLDNSSTSANSNAFLPGISLVFHTKGNNSNKGFLSGGFAVTYSRINDFNSSFKYDGVNTNNSIIDYFLEDAWGGAPNQFLSGGNLFNTLTEMGYNNYLIGDSTVIDPSASNTAYFTDVLGIPFQNETVTTSGNQNQWSVSYGANFSDRWFTGFGIGITSIRYKGEKTYEEIFQGEPLFNTALVESLEIDGTGINATFGFIGRPLDHVQIGAAVTTPTAYSLIDAYEASMNSKWDNFQYDTNTILTSVESSTDIILTEYKLRTPWKLSAGFSYFLKKSGFVSLDLENVNYGGSTYKDLSGSAGENTKINNLFKSVVNIRAGGEYRLKNYRLRAGYSFLPDPFKTEQNNSSRKLQRGSLGFGYRSQKLFLDFTIVQEWGSSSYRPYVINSVDSPLVLFDLRNSNVLLTVGFPF